ncbi:quinone oxidoreductase family protein [Granulibacter bethesdensis]|uniref:Quinone oxidoreductase, NADPH-dependent n=1 Tax=Granulibacter bethesdensis (strain ATCC BAA-1260 / CGDNIH1) TaxID=391165 RepID=Q0BW88_GRABC|nr:quinone oxidoreductase [Granulibacter bethesdensis]ABI60914.1 Quinone oxidoreductase, NADPH-dependent [Granulibacter bethesdensis CGDNIH1]AHJ66995.1 Quinone oxidoreductase, NADPH-dependent [Granulibacter bethesdensis]APH50676.1 Quinone oxidoreductase, NADPH-dependent [Granulibacter bethesdensis]APH63370.1 Quinone oxidoreductase, NADPH-dependent [Granulibacter bethesdensis]
MTKAIRMHAHGGPDVLSWEDVPTPVPGPGEAVIRHAAVGLNFIDIYFRSGLYKAPSLPTVLGMEGAGTVIEIGAGVTDIQVGDRVAYATGPLGAYATERTIAADRLVKLPDSISCQTAAAMMLQGLTAQYLLRRTYPVKRGDTILVYAAAGGVGLILCQWAAYLGASVIGVVSTEEKAALARAHGASHVIVSSNDHPADIAGEVRRITQGAMVPVVYDSVGKDTFDASLDCLAPLGLMVSYGNASGPVPPFSLTTLSAKGSLFVTRPSLATYTAKRADLLAMAQDLFDVVSTGHVHIEINQTYPLQQAAEAQRALEERRTTGSTILIP